METIDLKMNYDWVQSHVHISNRATGVNFCSRHIYNEEEEYLNPDESDEFS